MAGERAARLAKDQVHVAPIELAPGRMLATSNRFLVTDGMSDPQVREAISELVAEGAQVLVASSAFGVDTTGSEELVRSLAGEAGLLTTCGHEITRLYGLTTRTRTAVINASILPRMIATATMTEASVREAGISAPLMIMRGDGGVMDISEMRRRPVMTMLSGPAASVAGALMHLRVSDGLYFEVGGTSTNIGVIRNGRPTVTYARIGGHETYVSSLDVRVIGIAGGSLVRARPGAIVDVGPRSAHIAGLPYAAFADEADIVDPRIELFEPKPGDGADHVAVRVASGARYALTTTCAANALGYTQPGMHAHGNPQAARLAFAALAAFVGLGTDEAARRRARSRRRQARSRRGEPHQGVRARRRPEPADRRGRRRGFPHPLHFRAHGAALRDLAGCRGHLLDRRRAGPGARRGRAHHPASASRGPAGDPPRGQGGGCAGGRRCR